MEGISKDKPKEKRASKRIKSIKKKDESDENKIIISKGGEKQKKRKFIRRKARATIYIGHLPHGFYENEMNSYFSQFGKVLSVTVARSEKTGRSKGFAFVEFQDEEVAKIAAETMNNYLMYNRILKCKYIPPEERNRRLKKIDQFNNPKLINRKKEAEKKKASLTKLDKKTYLKNTLKKVNKYKKFFEERGIDFTLQLSNSDSKSEKKSKSSESITSKSSIKLENETDDQFGVLEIDESDNEIHFKTPPQVKKIIKRSLDSPLAPSKRLSVKSNTKDSPKGISKLKKSSKETGEKEGSKKTKKTIKSKLPSLKAPQVKTTQKTNQKSKVKLQSISKGSKKKINKEKITSAGVRKTRVKTRREK